MVIVEPTELVFSVPDPDRRLRGVRLWDGLDLPAVPREFRMDGDAPGGDPAGHAEPVAPQPTWTLRLPRPAINRLEYQVELTHPDGGSEFTVDPTNPQTTPGVFGPKSVLELPGYTPPVWLGTDPWPLADEFRVETGIGPVDLAVRSPTAATSRVVFAHDGPEYDVLASLGSYAAFAAAPGDPVPSDPGPGDPPDASGTGSPAVPPFHLVLAAPGARDDRYSASPSYTRALAEKVLPQMHERLGSGGPVVLIGASLGGLAGLALQRRYPEAVAGLFLQSGSFFTPQLDGVESRFGHFGRITRAVARVQADLPPGRPVPTVLTCGAAEENLRNNQLMARVLRRQGYPVTLHEVPDGHNYVAWRDALHPHLTGLLAQVWTAPG